MVYRKGIVSDPDLNSARDFQFVCMNLWSDAVFGSFTEDAVSLFNCEESCIAEYINVVGKTFSSNCRQHFVADEVNVFALTSFICSSYSVRSEKVGFDSDRGGFFDALDHA